MPSSTNWSSVAYGNGTFVAVVYASNAAAYSTNGTTWSTATLPSNSNWQSVAYGNGTFVAVASGPSTTAAYSTNGTTWSTTSLPSSNSWSSVAYGNGTFVAVATGPSMAAAYSANGTSWSTATLPSNSDWQSVAYGNGTFVAVANGSTAAAYSTNGTTWTAASTPSSNGWSSVAYGNGTFVAVAYNSTAAAYSTNGTTWSAASTPSSAGWYSVAYGNGTFVAVAYNSTAAAYSTNGTTWSSATLPSSSNWYSVAYGNGTFVAVAESTAAAAYLVPLSLVDTGTIALLGPPTQLAIFTQPGASATSGTALATQPVVEVEDAAGNVVTTASSTVTASFTSGGHLAAANSVTAPSGVATFSALTLNAVAGNYTLTFSDGSLTAAVSSSITLAALATVGAVNPDVGPVAGGTSVTITGTSFLATTAVHFGVVVAEGYTVNSSISISATSPAGSVLGSVPVTVTNPTGTSALSGTDLFTYYAIPAVTLLSPAAGPLGGGTLVTITGTGFVVGSGTTTVAFGAGAGTSVSCASTTSCTATSPSASAGAVDVRVTTPGGTSTTGSADQFTYDTTPTVTAVSPAAGPTAGRDSRQRHRHGFADAIATTGVQFAGTDAASFTIISRHLHLRQVPAYGAAITDITVTNETGMSAICAVDHFTYEAVPTVTGLSPVAGAPGGGTVVTITGTGLSSGPPPSPSEPAPATSSQTAPRPPLHRHLAGGLRPDVDITVTTPGAAVSAPLRPTSSPMRASRTVTSVSPAAGPLVAAPRSPSPARAL